LTPRLEQVSCGSIIEAPPLRSSRSTLTEGACETSGVAPPLPRRWGFQRRKHA
jgi:hypothetical protein